MRDKSSKIKLWEEEEEEDDEEWFLKKKQKKNKSIHKVIVSHHILPVSCWLRITIIIISLNY